MSLIALNTVNSTAKETRLNIIALMGNPTRSLPEALRFMYVLRNPARQPHRPVSYGTSMLSERQSFQEEGEDELTR